MIKSKEPTLGEVLKAVNDGFTGMQNQLFDIKDDIIGIKGEIVGIKGDVSGMKDDIEDLKLGQNRIERMLKSEIRDVDAHDKRIKLLENKAGT